MVNIPFFDKFQKVPITEKYIDGLVRSMADLKIAATPETPRIKRRLVELADCENEEEQEEAPISKKKKNSKKSKAPAQWLYLTDL